MIALKTKEKVLESVLNYFQKCGATVAYTAECCGRIYVGLTKPAKCRTCDKIPKVEEVVLN